MAKPKKYIMKCCLFSKVLFRSNKEVKKTMTPAIPTFDGKNLSL